MGEVLYVSDTSSRKVYRVRNLGQPKDPSRNLEVVAGTGEQCLPFDQSHCGEGRKATEAALNNPRGRRQHTLHFLNKSQHTFAVSMKYVYYPSVLTNQYSLIFGTHILLSSQFLY